MKAGSEYLPNSNVPAQSAEEFLYDFEETLRHEWEQSEWTIRSRIPIAKKLVDFLGDHPFTASRRDLREFLKVNGTQNAYKTIRVIYGRYFDTDLADGFKIPQSVVKPKRIPKDEEIKNCFYKLKNQELKACYLVLATSGIRRGELLSLTIKDIDLENKTIYPKGSGSTKKQWVSFYNEEAEPYILDLIDSYERGSIVRISRNHITKSFRKASKGKITPKVLREWFADKMGRLGVPDRYIDAFAAESHDRSWQGTTLTSQPGS